MSYIQDKVNLLHDYVYSQNDENIKLGNINLDEIALGDIKITKKSSNYNDIIDELFSGKMKEIYFNDNILVLKRYSDGLSVSLHISSYTDNDDNIENFNNNDALMSYILSPLVLNGLTKGILLPVINIDVDYQQVHDVLKKFSGNDYFINNPSLSIRVKENFFKSMTLDEYLKTYACDLKKILFQIIHTLAVINDKYPGFCHNKLTPKNIMVYLKKDSNGYDKFTFNNTDYYIPDSNFSIKLTNFNYSSIPEYFNTDKQNVNDIEYFINKLVKIIDFEPCDDETKKFISFLKSHKDNKMTSMKYGDIYNPIELINHSYFSKYKNKVKEMKENDSYIYGKRKQKGGAKFVKKPYSSQKYNPFLSNENRRVFEANKKQQKEPRKPIVLSKTIETMNPDYKPSFRNKPKFKNTWDTDYVGGPDKKHYVPQGKIHQMDDSNKPKKEYPSNKKYDDQPREFVQIAKPQFSENNNSTENNSTEKSPSRENIKKPHYDNKYKLPRSESPSRENKSMVPIKKPHYDNNRSDSRSESPSRDMVPIRKPHYDKESNIKNYKPQYKPNITEVPTIKETTHYHPPTMNHGQFHTHPTNVNPAFVDLRQTSLYPPAFVPEYSYMPNGLPFVNNYLKPNEIPLQKVYNINLGGAGNGHSVLNTIYNDTLPGEPYALTYSTLKERHHLREFFRNSVTNVKDGEDMTLQGGSNSLLSYLTLIHFNPYSVGGNPYKDIPQNFMLYNAAYPVKYDDGKIEIAKYSMGLNLRIYNLNVGALHCNTISDKVKCDHFDVWREMKYYEYIRDEILSKNVSPNFITLLTHKYDRKSLFNYNELNRIIKEHKVMSQRTSKLNDLIFDLNKLKQQNKQRQIDLTSDSGVSLITITEAPTTSFIEWMSPVYITNSAVKNMVSTGYHNKDVWMSILFQFIHAMSILQEHEILFRDFSIENNLFIKDLFANPKNVGYWEYIIDNMKFYVPNHGYLLLIDSRFTDIKDTNYVLTSEMLNDGEQKFKIISDKLYKINGTDRPVNIKQEIYKQFKNIFTNTMFEDLNKIYGITKPDPEIIDLVKKINSDTDYNITNYLYKYFKELLHSKVGTLIMTSEKSNININELPSFKKGELVVYQSRYDEFKWAVYVDNNNNKKKIITKDINDKYIEKDVFKHSLCYGKFVDTNKYIETYKN